MSAWSFRSSMKVCGKSTDSALRNSASRSVFQLDDRCAAAALILRRRRDIRHQRVLLQKFADGATQLAGTVAVNDAQFVLIARDRFVEKLVHPRQRLVDGASDDVQFREETVAGLKIDVDMHTSAAASRAVAVAVAVAAAASRTVAGPATSTNHPQILHRGAEFLAAHIDLGLPAVNIHHDAFEPET